MPAPAAAIYTKSISGTTQLFFQNGTSISQLTGSNLVAASGYTLLPGGIILQWGIATMLSGASTAAVVFPVAYDAAGFTPNVVSLPQAIITTGATPHNWAAITITNAGFTAKCFGGTVPANVIFNWQAIGKAA